MHLFYLHQFHHQIRCIRIIIAIFNQIVHRHNNINMFCFISKASFISVLQSLNGTQFLNATFVFASPPVTAIFPVTEIYASEKSQRLDSNDFVKNVI